MMRNHASVGAIPMSATPWGNGLGFDVKAVGGSWEFCLCVNGRWRAHFFPRGCYVNTKHGTGSTPDEARRNATNVED